MEMTPTVSSISAFPKVVHGLQVLLVESDQHSLQNHVYNLSQNSYRVTSTNKISTGLSMVANGNTFDCVLVDTENFEIDMVQFLLRVLKHQPQLPIIVMAWNDLQVLIAKQNLTNETIWFLQKPCGVSQICDILQRVCTRRINYIERASIRKSLQENLELNTFYNVDTMVNPSTNVNTTMINNNIPSSDGGHLSVNISQKYDAMFESQSYVEISSDDDEPAIKEDLCIIDRAKNKYKGKKPMKSMGKKPLMDHVYHEKGKGTTPRSDWSRAIHGLTNEPNLVVPSQTGNNLRVESYSCETSGPAVPFNDDSSMIPQSSNHLSSMRFNAMGISFMSIDNIKVKLLGAPQLNTITTINYSGGDQVSNNSFGDPKIPLIGEIPMSNALVLTTPDNNGTAQGSPPLYDHLPQLNTTTAINFSSGDHVSTYSFDDSIQPLIIGDISESNAVGLAENPDNGSAGQCIDQTISNNHTLEEATKFSNCFANVDYGVAAGSSVGETLAQIDRYGISIDSYGGGVADSQNQILKDLTFQEFNPYDLGGVSHPQDIHENGQNLLNVDNSMNLAFLNSDFVSLGHESSGLILPGIAVEENSNQTEIQHVNTIDPMDDDEWYMKVRQEFANPMDNGDGYYGYSSSNI